MSEEVISRSGGFQAADLNKRRSGDRRSSWLSLILGSIAAALFLATNLPWQLDDYDQAKQAYTSFEMVKEGHWLYQHTPHERIATKPPLVAWISAGIFTISRSWAIAWRLPSLGAAIALSILLFRAGNACGPMGGLFATSAFVFNLLTPRLATLVRTDMPLALVIFAIGLFIWNKIRKSEPWNARDRWSIFALLTAGLLIKGPIVYAFLLPGIAVAAVCLSAVALAKADDCRNRPHVWPGWWPWLASLSIFLLWAIGGSIFVPGFYDQVVIREFLGRFGETIHRPQPLLFYFPHLLHKFFPWSLLMIALAIIDLRVPKLDRPARSSLPGASTHPRARTELDRLARSSSRWWRERMNISPDTFWLICWIFGGLIVMSIIPSKRVDRIFPIVPPLCLLLAAQISGRENALRRPRMLGVVLLLSILWASGYSAFKIYTGYRDHRDALVAFGRTVRREATTHNWRYDAVKTGDEGMLLYLEKMHFVEPGRATAEWNRGNLDALVLPAQAAPALMRDLRDAAFSPFKSVERKNEPGSYVLITR